MSPWTTTPKEIALSGTNTAGRHAPGDATSRARRGEAADVIGDQADAREASNSRIALGRQAVTGALLTQRRCGEAVRAVTSALAGYPAVPQTTLTDWVNADPPAETRLKVPQPPPHAPLGGSATMAKPLRLRQPTQ
jgi:hypothetical protein